MNKSYLLQRYLKFYQSLDTGERKPDTEEQLRFVKVCRGELSPKTGHEIAYINYKKRESDKQKKTVKRSNNPKPNKITKLQSRIIKSNHNYKPRTPLEIQEFRNRVIEDEEFIKEKDYERSISAMGLGNINKKCRRCGSPMVWRERKSVSPTKYFLGCSRFPRCRYKEAGSW